MQHVWCLFSAARIMSLHVSCSCTGCQFAGALNKTCIMMHAIHNLRCSALFFKQPFCRHQLQHTRPGLCCSASMPNCVLLSIWTKFVDRAFSYARPVAWNSLSLNIIRFVADSAQFKKLLTTHFFYLTFNVLLFSFLLQSTRVLYVMSHIDINISLLLLK